MRFVADEFNNKHCSWMSPIEELSNMTIVTRNTRVNATFNASSAT